MFISAYAAGYAPQRPLLQNAGYYHGRRLCDRRYCFFELPFSIQPDDRH